MSKKKHYDLTVINTTCVIAFLLCVGFIFCFIHGRDLWKWEGYVLDTDVVGQYGDFIGGFVGTFLSVILLYYTFYQQRKDSSKNSKVYKKQQLNDDFYHLMSLYQDIISSLNFPATVGEEKLTGKEALHAYLDDMRQGFDNDGSTSLLRKRAVLSYMDFYARNRDYAPIYYRTLYRLCETLAYKEEGTEYKNVELVKILRAQLTDSEMVLMKYNALTRMGKPFQRYINHFNLLKHLPPLDLLEYKKYRQLFEKEEDVSMLNVVLVQIRQRMEDILDHDETNYVTLNEFRSTVSIALRVNENRDMLDLIITKREVAILQSYDSLNCIMKLDNEILEELFSYFIYDCVVLHNFYIYNLRKNLEFNIKKEDNEHKIKYTFSVTNKAHHPICMTWSQFSKFNMS